MTATLQNVTMYVGDNITITIGPITDPSQVSGYANLSGASAKWALAKSSASLSPDVLLQKTATITSQSNYQNSGNTAYFVNVTLVPNDTVNLPPSPLNAAWYHEAEVTDSSGNITVVTTGNFTLLWSVINQ